jgi:hypothetical protein
MRNPWRAFEELPGLTALPVAWERWMGDEFELFKQLCLQPDTRRPRLYPCPLHSGCAYAIRPQTDGSFYGDCQREPPRCPQTTFNQNDLLPLQLSWNRLGRALCHAFALDPKPVLFPLPATRQIGSWSNDSVPVILTIQFETDSFHLVISALGNRLRRPYILLGPTNLHVDGLAQELLANAQAEFLPLDATVRLTHNATLASVTPPGNLFAKLTPQPPSGSFVEAMRSVMRLIKQLDLKTNKPPLPSRVFELYCIDCMSIDEIAIALKSPKGRVVRRLQTIARRSGKHPRHFRQFSDHLHKLKETLSDSRAHRIQLSSAIDGNDGEDED